MKGWYAIIKREKEFIELKEWLRKDVYNINPNHSSVYNHRESFSNLNSISLHHLNWNKTLLGTFSSTSSANLPLWLKYLRKKDWKNTFRGSYLLMWSCIRDYISLWNNRGRRLTISCVHIKIDVWLSEWGFVFWSEHVRLWSNF